MQGEGQRAKLSHQRWETTWQIQRVEAKLVEDECEFEPQTEKSSVSYFYRQKEDVAALSTVDLHGRVCISS